MWLIFQLKNALKFKLNLLKSSIFYQINWSQLCKSHYKYVILVERPPFWNLLTLMSNQQSIDEVGTVGDRLQIQCTRME